MGVSAIKHTASFYTKKQYIMDMPVLERLAHGTPEQQRWLEWFFMTYLDRLKKQFPKKTRHKFGEWLALTLEMNAVNPKEAGVIYDYLYDPSKRVGTYEFFGMATHIGLNYYWIRLNAGMRHNYCLSELTAFRERKDYLDMRIVPKYTEEQHEAMVKMLFCIENFTLALPQNNYQLFQNMRVKWFQDIMPEIDKAKYIREYNRRALDEYKIY